MTGLLWRASAWRHTFVWAFAAGMGLALAAMVAATAYGVYEVRAAGDGARYPVQGSGVSAASTTSLSAAWDDAPGQGQFSVVTLYPGSSDAPLPPGLPAGLAPGDVALSPHLMELDESQKLQERYGPVSGTIAAEGLGAPDENLVYIIGEGKPPSGAQRVSEFGAPISPWAVGSSSAFFGESLTIQTLSAVLPAVAVLVVLPAIGLAVSCARRVADRRRRRDGVLEALGAPVRFRWTITLRSALPGLLAGSCLAAVTVWAWSRSQPTVPYVDFVVSPETLPIPRTVLVTLAALGIGLGCFALPGRRGPGHTRPGPARSHLSAAWILAGPVAVALASWLPDQVAPPPGPLNVILRWGLSIASLVAVAVSVSAALIALGTWLREQGHRRGRVSTLITGASLQAMGRNFLVLTLAVGSMCFAAFFAAQYAALGQSFSVEGRSLNQVIGPSVAVVEMPEEPAARRFLQSVPDGLEVVSVRGSTLTGQCTGLEHLGFACDSTDRQSPASAVLQAANLPPEATARTGQPRPQEGEYLLVDTTGAAVDVPELKKLAYQASGQVTPVGELASRWITATDGLLHQLRWVSVWAAVGLTLGLAGVLIAFLGTQAEQSRRIAPVLALFGPARARTAIIVGLTTGLPLLTAGVASIFAHLAQSAPFLARIDMPGAFIPLTLTLMALVLIAAMLMSIVAAWKTLEDAEDWTPGGK
ncbi:hypothetical protein [Janibacter indicus]|uniref:hypothetical protein n=1 Tax=Janibacter indicus TaxID=857417 RepID=UPI003D9A1334